MKYNFNDLMETLFNTKRMITNNMTTFYCVADKIIKEKSDLIEYDIFYKLFVEAWKENVNGSDSEMIKLLSDVTGRTVTDIHMYRTECIERNVDFKVENDESTYSIAVPILKNKKPVDDIPFEYVESYIKSFEIRLYKVNAGRTNTYERLSSFPCSDSDATAREVIRYWFETENN